MRVARFATAAILSVFALSATATDPATDPAAAPADGSASSTDPSSSPDGSSTNATLTTPPSASGPSVPNQLDTSVPPTRAQQVATSADNISTYSIESDPGLQACQKDSSSGGCQDAMTSELAKFTQNQQDVAADLTNVAVQLNSILAQEAGGQDKIAGINTAVYGDGSTTNQGLINQLAVITQALQDIQDGMRQQSTDIANKSATVRSNTDATLQSIKAVMDVKLADVEKQINDMLQSQVQGQQQDLVNSAQSMQQAATNAQTIIASNTNNIKANIQALSDATDSFIVDTNNQLGTIAQGTEANVQNIQALKDSSNESLDQLQSTMTDETNQAVASAVKQGQATLAATLNSTQSSLADVATQAGSDLNNAGASLQNDIASAQAELSASLSDSRDRMQQADNSNKKAISDFSTTASSGITALSTAQDAAGQQLSSNAQLTKQQLSDLAALIANYQKASSDSIQSVQGKVSSLVGPIQQSVSDKLKAQSSATGDELLSINSNIASVLNGVSGSSSSALAALAQYISDAQNQAGQDASNQQNALSDTQAAIAAAQQLAQGKMNVASDQASSTLQALMGTLGPSLDDTASTVNDVNAANSAKQRDLQNQFQQMIVSQQGSLSNQVNAVKMSQQQDLSSLQSTQAQKSQQIAQIIADLSNVFGNVNSASQASQNSIKSLQSQLSQTQGTADSEVAQLFNLIAASQSAAGASVSGAQSQIQLAVSGMSDQLSQSLKNYANQFTGDFSGAVSDLTNMSSSTLLKLQQSQALQANSTNDAASLAQKLLSDLAQLESSGQSQVQSLGNLFQSQALSAGLSRQAQLKAITDAAQGQMSDLQTKANAMIDSQSQGLAASMGQSVNNTLGQLSGLIDSLRAQQIGAISLASQTDGAVKSVQQWTSDLSNQISSAQGKVDASKQTQLAMLQALQDDLNTWSSAIDKNISIAQQQIQDGMAMIPNVTAQKASDTEAMFSANNVQMQQYLAQLKSAFDNMRATEAEYVKEQSLRRLGVLLGISQASLDNSNVLMQLLGVTDLNQLGDATQIATVLSGLADGVSGLQAKNGDAFAALQGQISNLDANSKGLFGQLMNSATGSLTGLYSKYADDQHALQQTIQAAADTDRVRNQALNDALNGMLGTVRNGSMVLNSQLASDRKDVYGVDGDVRQLGDQSSLAISRLINSVREQSANTDSAIAMSQKVNADRVASVRDVVISFVNAMQEYVQGSRVGFDDIHNKLGEYKEYLESKLNTSDGYMLGMAQSTQSELSATADLATALQNRIESFNAIARQQLFNVEEERSAIEQRHETELNELKSKLQNVTLQIQADQASTASQVDDWLNQEDIDLGFVKTSTSTPAIANANSTSTLAVVKETVKQSTAPTVTIPDWARDDAATSFAQIKQHRRDATNIDNKTLKEEVKRNMEAIHKEAQLVGIVV